MLARVLPTGGWGYRLPVDNVGKGFCQTQLTPCAATAGWLCS